MTCHYTTPGGAGPLTTQQNTYSICSLDIKHGTQKYIIYQFGVDLSLKTTLFRSIYLLRGGVTSHYTTPGGQALQNPQQNTSYISSLDIKHGTQEYIINQFGVDVPQKTMLFRPIYLCKGWVTCQYRTSGGQAPD